MKDPDLTSLLQYLSISQLNGHLNPETGAMSNERLRSVFMALLQHVQPRVFFDIGSRDGESATAVRSAFPDCRCYAFEANPSIFAQFDAANRERGLIDYRNLAVGDREGTVDLFIPRVSTEVVIDDEIVPMHHVEAADTGRSSLLRRTDPGAEYDIAPVPVTRLDAFCKQERITKLGPTAVWIDVEGAASVVLAGAKVALRQCWIVFIEVEGHAFWDEQQESHTVVGQLLELGFVPVARDREYFDKQFNVLLVRPQLLPTVAALLFDAKSPLSEARSSTAGLTALARRVEVLEAEAPASFPPLVGRFTPVLIPAFNNPTFLRSMLEQLEDLHHANIVVIDNASTYPPMLEYLEQIEGRATVRRLPTNDGPRAVWTNPAIFDVLPQVFAVTDPDLRFDPDLPQDFLVRLFALSLEHRIGKVGLALDISDPAALRQEDFLIDGRRRKIWEWESQFWTDEVEPGVYRGLVDTTFALYNKAFFDPANPLDALRVAGHFTMQHLPWLQDFELPIEEAEFYRRTNTHSFYFPNEVTGPPKA